MSKNTSPLVSIITVTYNHEKFIGPCIESVLQQTYPNWEQIIVDDGSTDRTAEIIRGFSDSRIRYFHQENRGIEALAESYNRALTRSAGHLIAILEGDDLWPPDKLSTMVPAFDDVKIVLGYGAVAELSNNGMWAGKLGRAVRGRKKLPRAILFNDPVGSATHYMLRADGVDLIPPSTVVIRRSALESIGGFQYVSDLCVVDYPTFLRLSLSGNFSYNAEVMGYRRRHLGSATFQNLTRIAMGAEKYACQFLEQHGLNLTAEERREMEGSWRSAVYDREFTAGRLCLVNQKWPEARLHFRRALNPLLMRVFLAAAVGWVLSWIHSDLEHIMRLFRRADLREQSA